MFSDIRRVACGGAMAGAEGRAGVRQDGTETVSEPRTDSLADRVHDLDCRLSRMEGAHRWLSFGMWIEGAGPLAETRRERLADRVHNLDCRLSRMEGAHLWLSPWTRTLAETPAACLADRVHNLDCRLSRMEGAHAVSPCSLLVAPGPEQPPAA